MNRMVNIIKEKLDYKFFVILIILLAVIARFISLEKMSFWEDELLTLSFADATKSVAKIVHENLTYPDQSPPLFTLLLHLWLKIFGQKDGWLRTLPALISCLSIIAVWRLFSVMERDKKILFIYLILISFSGYYLYLGRELRPYGLLLLMAIANHYYFFAFILNNLNKKTNFFYSLTLLTGVMANPFMWLVFFSQVFYLCLIRERLKIIKIIKLSMPAIILYTPYSFIIAKEFTIYKSFPLFSHLMVKKFAGLFLHLSTGFRLATNVVPEKYIYLFSDIWFIPSIVLTMIMFFLVVRIFLAKGFQDKTDLFCFVNILVPILLAALIYRRRVGPRTLCIVAPFYHYLAIKGAGLFLNKRGFILIMALVLFIKIFSGQNLMTSSINPYIPEDWKSLVKDIEKEQMYLIATKGELELIKYYSDNLKSIEYDSGKDIDQSWLLLTERIKRISPCSVAILVKEIKIYPMTEFSAQKILDRFCKLYRFEGIESYGQRLKLFKFRLERRDNG